MKRLIAVLAIALLMLISAVSAGNQTIGVKSQDNRTTPSNMSIDTNAFLGAGCAIESYKLNCSSIGLEPRFNCSYIRNTSDELGGLSPKLPIVVCAFSGEGGNAEDGVVQEGCLIPEYRRYIVRQDGEFKLIRTKEEFLSMFAPVETPEEALAFAVALTNAGPKYDASTPEGYFPVTSSIEPTYVEENKGVYKVHLFHRPVCGCGTHPYYAVDYLVTKDGEVSELSQQKVYDSHIEICVD